MDSDQKGTDTPIIGVLSQETYVISYLISGFPDTHSYIAASYVKFLESAGARVIPVWIGQDESYYRRVVESTNGILFPGGGTYFNETGGYGTAATYLYKLAIEQNKNGTYYPILGVCLGMQVLMYAALDGTKDIRGGCDLRNVAVPLDFVDGYKDSRLFANTPNEIVDILRTKNVSYNLHRYCITKAILKENNLSDDWKVLTTNKDINDVEFISAMEHTQYPIYGLQFHPEKNAFEFKRNKGFPHSSEAVKASQYFSIFFVDECRKNKNSFVSDELEIESLIYNFNPKYTGLNKSYYEQIYLFTKNDFEKVQLL